jgi:hypothetical protein
MRTKRKARRAAAARQINDGNEWIELAVPDSGGGMTTGAAGKAVLGIQRIDASIAQNTLRAR